MSETNDKDNPHSADDSSLERAKPNNTSDSTKSKKPQNKGAASTSAVADKALTTPQKNKKTDKKSAPAIGNVKKTAAPRRVTLLILFVLLIVFVVAGTSYWVFGQNQQLAKSLTAFSAQQSQQDNNLTALQSRLDQLNQQQQSLDSKIAQAEKAQFTAKLSFEQVSAQLQAMASEKGKDPLLWRLSEVDYLLSIANHRLLLERDIQTAKVALQDADTRLKAIGDPALIIIREKIASEINQLNSVSVPDIAGLAAQISGLMDGIGQLPLVKKEMTFQLNKPEAESIEGNSAGEWAKKFFNDIVSGLFQIQRTEQAIEPLLLPDEKHYLSQNLGLKLEQARIALLHANTAIFQRNLRDIQQWVQRYFDQESASVTNLLQTVQQLQSIDLAPTLPDISASLRELRSWIKRQQSIYSGLNNHQSWSLSDSSSPLADNQQNMLIHNTSIDMVIADTNKAIKIMTGSRHNRQLNQVTP
ncbi:MAG: hypothetical protein GXP08_16445 [Gammaproteobacteria bacterium]|nr:hypothetical protein [Gammaproteobacteria bacterium]